MLLVKLADRLHNMRTLHFIKNPDKRRRIARETMEIYAPLAERIGMEGLKAELEDLAFAELSPDARASILHRLRPPAAGRRGPRRPGRRRADGACWPRPASTAEVIGREKTPYSIWRKMQRKNISFEQLSDIMAFRVLVDIGRELLRGARRRSTAPTTCCPAASRTTSARRSRTATARCTPPSSAPSGRKIEVQIRTARDARAWPSSASRRTGPTSRQLQDHRGPAVPLAPRAAGHPRARQRSRGVPREHQARDVPGPGVLLHPQGRPDRLAARRHAGRLRLRGPLPGRRQLRRRQDRRPHGPAAHPAAERRPGRDHHEQERRRRRRTGSGSSSPARRGRGSAATFAARSATST